MLFLLYVMYLGWIHSSHILAQDQHEYVPENVMEYRDKIYKNNIKGMRLHESSYERSPAAIAFGSGQQLLLSFDDLELETKTYTYTLIHCDANWQPTDLFPNEYLLGFFEENISAFSYSTNTLIPYVHYQVLFPNTSIGVSKSGNYLLKLFQNGDKEDLVLTSRFVVYDDLIQLRGMVHQASGADNYFNKQEVDFTLWHPNYKMTQIDHDLKIVIQQNGRWDNAIKNIKPQFIKENELTFDYDDGTNCFESGNEFRFFDTKDIVLQSQQIKEMKRDSLNNGYDVWLLNEADKSNKRYVFEREINGDFIIRANRKGNPDIEGEYMRVHFFLPYEVPMYEGNIYVLGDMTQWNFEPENRLIYNERKKGYEGELLLKQGYYNYQLAYLKDQSTIADVTWVEGNHWETENEYTVYVYHKAQGTFYDQLIGYFKLNSIRK